MRLRRTLALIAAALLFIGSFFLPNAAAGVTDARRLNNINMIDTQSVIIDAVPGLSLSERIELTANPNAELVAWKSGNIMNEETAEERAIQELARFFSGGSFAFDYLKCSLEDISAVFIIDPEAPTASIIVWELTLVDANENMAIVTMDDETGYITKIIFRQGRGNQSDTATVFQQTPTRTDEELYATAMLLTELMAEYYGLRVILADYHFSGSISYYRADIHDDGRVIPMFGVVRALSFTTNERV